MATVSKNVSTWLIANLPSADRIKNGSIAWPFPNIPISALPTIAGYYPPTSMGPYQVSWGIGLSVLGVLLSSMSIAAAWRKAMAKNSFYGSMMIISVLDLIFNAGHLIVRSCRDWVSKQGGPSYELMILMNLIRGVTFSISLISDLSVLSLSIERHFSISKPQLYHNSNQKRKRYVKFLVGASVALLGSCRMHYAFSDGVEQRPDSGKFFYYANPGYQSSWVTGLRTFSDMLLPAVLLVTMLIVSSRLCFVLIKRTRARKKKVGAAGLTLQQRSMISQMPRNYSNQVVNSLGSRVPQLAFVEMKEQKNVLEENTSNAVILTLIMDFLFIANQSAYCLYTIAQLLRTYYDIASFDNTLDQLLTWCRLQLFMSPVSFLTVMTECASHALNFLFYMAFSHGYRKEFVLVLKKIRG